MLLILNVERRRANIFESCMGVNWNILCRQAISIMATWKAGWLVNCNNLLLFSWWDS